MTTGAKGWARRSNSLGKKKEKKVSEKKEPKKNPQEQSSYNPVRLFYFILFFFRFERQQSF